MGALDSLPSFDTSVSGFIGFSLSAQQSIEEMTFPIGTRYFGYCYTGIFHGIAIALGGTVGIVRQDSNGWYVIADLSAQ